MKHNNNPGIANNTEYTIWMRATTFGEKSGMKKLKFKFSYPPVNSAPKF